MPISWTFPQLALILLIGFTFLAMAFSKSKPMHQTFVPILAAHYLVINTTCWIAFMHTTSWQRGDVVFQFGFSHLLASASFSLGILATLGVAGSWISVLRQRHQFSKRQVIGFSGAMFTFVIGLVVSTRTPLAMQAVVDSLPVRH